MAMAGGLGMALDLDAVSQSAKGELLDTVLLFSESNSRFLVEVAAENAASFSQGLQQSGVSLAQLGTITEDRKLTVTRSGKAVLDVDIDTAKNAWQKPLDW